LGYLLGGIDFSNFFLVISGQGDFSTLKAATDAGAVTINYGLFLNTLINFLIVAFALFIIVKQINKLAAPRVVEKPGDPPPPEDIRLLREIRDALVKGKA
jgi:large conductance mechanosensitive channel